MKSLKFDKKKKAQRAYEKKHKLPKKRMNSPVVVVVAYMIAPIIILSSFLLIYSFIKPMRNTRNTKDTLRTIVYLLKLEKEHSQQYPETIDGIARRNPTYGDLTVDSWDNAIIFQKAENGKSFTLISIGKDGILATDDISVDQTLE